MLIVTCLFLLCKPLKRKTGVADGEVESAGQNAGPGSVAVIKGPFQTPPSAKSGKFQKVPRTTKANKGGSQIPMANVGKQEYNQFLSWLKFIMISFSNSWILYHTGFLSILFPMVEGIMRKRNSIFL